SVENVFGVEYVTLSATFVGEAYMIAGLLGVVVGSLLIGMGAQYWTQKAFSKTSNFGVLIYGSGFLALVISMRSIYWLPVAILPGFWVAVGGARWQVNWHLPDVSQFDFVVLSSFTSLTGQWLIRSKLRGRRWLFWGERLRAQPGAWKRFAQEKLTAPLVSAS